VHPDQAAVRETTQGDLAKRAGVRVETLSRLEHAKHSPNVATIDKIVRALEQAEAVRSAREPPTSAAGRKGSRHGVKRGRTISK
jgi:transcriptional regulator with XRE-family HTH domain